MRRGHRKMWWGVVVPCTSRKILRTESRKDIEEILNTKLATINEEPEMIYDENWTTMSNHHLRVAKKGKKNIVSKVKMGRFFMPHFICFKDSYLVFINGVAPRGRPAGLPQT